MILYKLIKENIYGVDLINPILYRITVINDFKNTTSTVNYKKFSEMSQIDSWIISPNHKGYDIKEDAIFIFLNYKQIFKTKNKKNAISFIEELINNISNLEIKNEFELCKEYLFKAIK